MIRFSPADAAERRRYNWSVMGLMAAYAGALIGVNVWFSHAAPHGLIAYVAAALPALPIIGVFFAIGRFTLRIQDEYQRYLLVRQLLIATAFALAVATIWGFIESFGLAPHVPAYYAAILWFGGLGLGSCINALIERGGGEA